MMTLYHGTTKLFREFRPQDTIGTGEGKSKFGWGTYLTSAFATAVLYSGKGPGRNASDHYVYSVEIPNPETNEDKYFVLHKPVPKGISILVEKELGPIKDSSALEWGNDFRTQLQQANPRKPADTWSAKLEGDKWVGSNLTGRLLMELRDNGKLEYKLPEDALEFIKIIKE